MEAGAGAQKIKPCDQCLHRKVRCDKSLPRCHRCIDASLNCTREIVRQRPGPKKGKGAVISRLRVNSNPDRRPSLTNTTTTNTAETSPAASTFRFERATENGGGGSQSPATSYSVLGGKEQDALTQDGASPPALLSLDAPDVLYYVDQFFDTLYPIWPIIHQGSFRKMLGHPESIEPIERCLILALCALTVLHVHTPSPTTSSLESRKAISRRFIDQCTYIRSQLDYIEDASLATVQTSFFLSIAEVEFQRVRVSWFLLQEAIMLAQELGYYDTTEIMYDEVSFTETLSRRRTLYLLSLTERGLTLLRNKPFSMTMVYFPPEAIFENEDPRILYGLQSLNQLFVHLDEPFLQMWVNGSIKANQLQIAKIHAAQQNLSTLIFDAQSMTDIQKADILVTHQWMRLVFWQASMRQGLLSSSAEIPAMSYQYPCQIASDLCTVLRTLTSSAIFNHGMAIYERVFEIAYSFIDSLKLAGTLASGHEELRTIFRLLRASPNSHSRYTQILESKIIEGEEVRGRELLTLVRTP